MEKKSNMVSKLVASIVETMIEKDSREWPPICPFFTYHPERPQKKEE